MTRHVNSTCPRCVRRQAKQPISAMGFGCSLVVVGAIVAVVVVLVTPLRGLAVFGGFTGLFLLELLVFRGIGHRMRCAVQRAYAYSFGLVRWIFAAFAYSW